ncbi:MAG: TIGR02808 family protein [Pseudomonadales bacterium]|uniref:TIGR02808 family protein n=1 Tax=Oleiphilus messinensis TaxID=141451 RepID=A0A1Y0I1V8_9GAMM|nr:TIGR02808 family protein [Oleiphilus messinensis]ARU54199.1 hypothetical protein OLMES_0090 [Oleiphilus messinensis]MCG8611154.1 TIGR02808 family protein [Pseudomonadales bacterium]
MSALESMIWTILGYLTMPAVFIVGFVVTAVVLCFVLDVTGKGAEEP